MNEIPEYQRPIDLLESYKQTEMDFGGIASLLMVYRAHGIQYTEDELKKELFGNTGGGWAGFLDLMEHAHNQGFAIIYRTHAHFDQLKDIFEHMHEPIIVAWTSNRPEHKGSLFSVVKHVEESSITLADPMEGDFFTIPAWKFLGLWNGLGSEQAFLYITPNGDFFMKNIFV